MTSCIVSLINGMLLLAYNEHSHVIVPDTFQRFQTEFGTGSTPEVVVGALHNENNDPVFYKRHLI